MTSGGDVSPLANTRLVSEANSGDVLPKAKLEFGEAPQG